MLYDRDYKELTDDEIKQWEKTEYQRAKSTKDGIISPSAVIDYWEAVPKAATHYMQLFPNNYLDISDVKDTDAVMQSIEQLRVLLDSGANEREVLNYIRDTQSFSMIGAVLLYNTFHFNFGHHGAFLFREFPLGTTYTADFLVVGKNSGGYEFVFIELESPKGSICLKDGDLGEVIRKGISQVKDWDRWLIGNYNCLQSEFDKHLGKYEKVLPKEFYKLDKNRLHYVVIAGRRTDYNEKTYALRRELFKENNITLLHYDNLLDANMNLLTRGNY